MGGTAWLYNTEILSTERKGVGGGEEYLARFGKIVSSPDVATCMAAHHSAFGGSDEASSEAVGL